jgi:hypothetical protein
MRLVTALITGSFALALPLAAAPPPAEQLLPSDTLAVMSVPDWNKLQASRKDSPVLQLWNDEAFRPFRDKFLGKLAAEILEPMQKDLGIRLTNYAEILQGQLTLAVTQRDWKGTRENLPGFILLIDAKDKSDALKKNLEEVKQKLVDAGKKVRVDKIRDVEFFTLVQDLAELERGLEKTIPEPKPPTEQKDQPPDAKLAPKKQGQNLEISFGRAESLLLVGTSAQDLERILVRLSGGGSACLAEQAAFQACQQTMFREALGFGWVNFPPLAEALLKWVASLNPPGQTPNPMGPTPERIFGALGVNSVKTLAFGARQAPDGEYLDAYLGAPEEGRRGLLRMLSFETKEAGPPSFVPADTTQFIRWRMDGQKFWAATEAAANEISPGMLGFLLAQVEVALKEKDPTFDFKKNFVANLGDDLISYQKFPRGTSLDEFASPPSLILLNSPNPDQFIQALRSLAALMPGRGSASEDKEREFLGRKIYSITLGGPLADRGAAQSLLVSSSGGYVAMSTDTAMVEEYLRSSESKPKPLAEAPGLADAVQKVGGTATGFFGYQNDTENMRALITAFRSNADALGKAFASTPFAAKAKGEDKEKVLKEWFDFSLLPPFDRLAKYFYLTVYAARTSREGFHLKLFSPTPPQMRR